MADRSGSGEREIQPPLSRLFVICSKNHTEEELRASFSEFGHLEDVWVVKDKQTRENKGIAYIKFSRASAAAVAMETLDGGTIGEDPKQVKVLIAAARHGGQSYDMSNGESRNRLFVVVPRDSAEDQLQEVFSTFEGYETSYIVRNRSGEPKGFGYVKFKKPSLAALAMESCDSSYRAVIAEPKEARFQKKADELTGQMPQSKLMMVNPPLPPMNPMGSGGLLSTMAQPGLMMAPAVTPQRLYVIIPTSVTQDQFSRLFDIAPGMLHCNLKRHHTTGQSRGFGYVTFATPAQAQYAREKINNLEYPPGGKIVVKFAEDPPSMKASPASSDPMLSSHSDASPALAQTYFNAPNSDANPAAFSYPQSDFPAASDGTESRLFIVCSPSPPSDSILRSVFSHFGSLLEIYTVRDHNYGYARYSSKQAADMAMQHLHGADVAGCRLKVVPAEPPRKDGARIEEPSRKRPRT